MLEKGLMLKKKRKNEISIKVSLSSKKNTDDKERNSKANANSKTINYPCVINLERTNFRSGEKNRMNQ